jgi:predicted nucleotidyltransferase
MNNEPILTSTLRELSRFKPKSVFLYGSRGRGDFKTDSDYEIGVIFDDEEYVQRSEIHAAISDTNVKAYPFKWSELSSGTFGHVFQKSIYLREIILGGRTIAGVNLIEHIAPVPVTTLDLIQRIRFDIGMALASLLSYRSGDMQTSMEEFSKSCLFGLRCLEILKLEEFPVGYDEIYRLSAKVVDEPKYLKVIEAAYAIRKMGDTPKIDILYENISLLDTFIEPRIVDAFKVHGIRTII